MAIAYDSASSGTINANTVLTFSHTCTGSDLVLVVGTVNTLTGTPAVTSVTYGGQPLTFIRRRLTTDATPDQTLELWYKIGPLTGANDVVVTWNTSGDLDAGAISLTGVLGLDSSTDNIGTGTTASLTASTGLNGCWVVDFVSSEAAHTVSDANHIERLEVGVGTILSGGTKSVAKASNTLLSWTLAISDWVMGVVSFKPVETSTGASIQENKLRPAIFSPGRAR